MYTLIVAQHLNGCIYLGNSMDNLSCVSEGEDKIRHNDGDDFTDNRDYKYIFTINGLDRCYSATDFTNHTWIKKSDSTLHDPASIDVLYIFFNNGCFYVSYIGYGTAQFSISILSLLQNYSIK